jgi:hypothetical protein
MTMVNFYRIRNKVLAFSCNVPYDGKNGSSERLLVEVAAVIS